MSPPRPDSSTASLLEWGARLAPPVAAVLALASLAAFQADPRAAAETAFLALAAGMTLLAAAAVSGAAAEPADGPWPAAAAVAGSLLVTVAVWTLPAGPARGAVAMVLAAATLAAAGLRWLPGRAAHGGGAARVVAAVALAVSLQALLRSGELLGFAAGPGEVLRSALVFAAFPLVGAAAVLALARLHGRRRALLAAAAVLLVGPGFRPATLAVLVALSAAPSLLRRDPLAAWRSPEADPSPGAGRARGAGVAVRLGALALLAAPFAWDARAAGAALAAGLAGAAILDGERADGGRFRLGLWLPAAAAAAVLAVALALPGRPWEEAVPLAALVPLALPALALPERGRAPLALAALVLAAAAARGVLVEGALAAPAALAALAVPRRGAVAAVQGAWSGALLVAASLLAAYPWLRPAPLPGALALFGLPAGLPGALAAVAGVALLSGLGLLVGRSGRAGGSEPAALRAAGAALAVLALLRVPAAGAAPLDTPALILDGDRPAWTADLGGGPGVRAVVLDSSLANAAGLPEGTPVATLRLRSPGRPDRTWTLATGADTGEWAADRPDLRALRPPAPDPWLSWVAEEGAFFGRRYRTVLRPDEAASPDRLELRLRPDLPPEVVLSVFHLELRP